MITARGNLARSAIMDCRDEPGNDREGKKKAAGPERLVEEATRIVRTGQPRKSFRRCGGPDAACGVSCRARGLMLRICIDCYALRAPMPSKLPKLSKALR
jgi:hypothetical protein